MRYLITLLALALCINGSSMAANKPTREETIQWLREKLTLQRQPAGQKPALNNATYMWIDINLHAPKNGDIKDADFKTRIESYVSWKNDEMNVQNDIYEHGRLKETFTYQIPLSAITDATVTNCPKNASGNVNAYKDRPVFIVVKKNSTKVGHIRFDKNNKATSSNMPQYHMNSKDGDWESMIPIAGNWDKDDKQLKKILDAFAQVAAGNKKQN